MELDHQVELWRSFLEIAPAGVAIFDREMRYLEVSNRWIDEFRLPGRDVIGRCHYDVFPEIPARWREIHRRCLQGAVERSDADCLLRADGRVDWMRWEVRPWHDRAGAIGGIVIFSEDISEQKRAEAGLRASEDRFRSIFGAISDGIVIASHAGRVIEVNESGRAMFGYGPGELTGLDIAALSSGEPPYTAAEIARRIAAACSIDRPQLFNWQCKARDGRLFWCEISLRAARISGTEVVVAVLRDLTQRLAIDAQLRQSQKMDAIGNLTGGLAHDFNNVLAVIIGNLEELRAVVRLDAGADVLANEALAAAEWGAQLTGRLLAFARQQPLAPKRIDPNDLLVGLARLLHRTLGADVDVVLDLAREARSVLVDPTQLEEAILNLASNARDAMPKGGRLTITTSNRSFGVEEARQLADMIAGDYVVISVADTGTGMTDDQLRHMFEPFYTTKARGRGTGLGLALVFGFVKQSGGHINVYSEPGRGTTFRIYLPQAEAAPACTAPGLPLPIRTAPRGTGQTILAVDDNPDLRRLVIRQLERLGYTPFEATNAAEALEILERQPIDLVFTDVIMPGGTDGTELARRVMERWPGTKVVLTSGYSETGIAERSAPILSSLRLLTKPYKQADFAQALHDALEPG